MRNKEELTKRILEEQQKNPTPGDFVELVENDFIKIGKKYDVHLEDFIITTNEKSYKKLIKQSTREAAFKTLKDIQMSHKKVNHINYEKFECQEYLRSGIFSNEEISILSSLRSHTLRTIKCNFKNFYQENLNCPLQCSKDGDTTYEDTQQHLISCKTILQHLSRTTISQHTIRYEDIYGDIYKQKALVSMVMECMNIRNTIMQNQQPTSGPAITLDPSTQQCCMNTNSKCVCIGTSK